MSNKLNFEIITPEGIVFSDQVDEVILPTPLGEIGILPHHIPLVSLLSAGEARIKKGTAVTYFAISGGFIEVKPDKVVVLADTAERPEEIDEQRAEEARKKAQELLKTKRTDAQDFTVLAAKMEKELARLKVVKRRRRKEPPLSPRSSV